MNKQWILAHLLEALDELKRTVARVDSESTIDVVEFEMSMAHLYGHLNTSWNSRFATDEELASHSEEDFILWRAFPSDIFLGR